MGVCVDNCGSGSSNGGGGDKPGRNGDNGAVKDDDCEDVCEALGILWEGSPSQVRVMHCLKPQAEGSTQWMLLAV